MRMGQVTDGRWYEVEDVHAELAARDKRIAELGAMLKNLTWRVVANAGRLSEERKPRWSHVSDVTASGSTTSAELCVSAGFDPDENCGGKT